ncbi:MAG: transcription termination factor NusA, partial [Chitinispirillaceae bacterium]|nr:transcription termination factor NusA [Chitinispirillaceae bacterium]
DIVTSLITLAKEKGISLDLVLNSLKDALITASKKYLGKPINVEAKIDREKGTIELFTRQIVVEKVENPELEISLDEAKKIDENIEIDDEIVQDLDIDLLGRAAIQTAKQIIIQRIREAERDKIFEDYSERIGELVTGTVQQVDKGNVLVNLGRTEALLPYREQIRKEKYRQGQTIKACIIEVKNNSKGPQVIISRTCPEFLARLFELEVPEIFDKTVKIVKVVREPGYRAKIAVTTSDSKVDPVGACVGMRGNRVQAIVRELSNERIDIINWTDEFTLLVRRVFAPAEIKRVITVSDKKIVVVVRDEDLAVAIGKDGQNIRLASKMLEKEIDIYGEKEYSTMTEEQRAAALKDNLSKESKDNKNDKDKSEDENSEEVNEPEEVELEKNEIIDDEEIDSDEEGILGRIANKAIDTLSMTDIDANDAINETDSQ